jgi:hypothetical protein
VSLPSPIFSYNYKVEEKQMKLANQDELDKAELEKMIAGMEEKDKEDFRKLWQMITVLRKDREERRRASL